jgi:hypothetical protein
MVWNTSCCGNSHTSSVPSKEPVTNKNFSQLIQAGSQKLYAHAYTQCFSAPNSREHISFIIYQDGLKSSQDLLSWYWKLKNKLYIQSFRLNIFDQFTNI